MAVLVFLLPNFLFEFTVDGRDFSAHSQEYLSEYASFKHFLEWRYVIGVILSFLCYSVVSPIEKLVVTMSAANFTGYFESYYQGIVFLAVYIGFILYPLIQAAREKDPLIIAISAWIAVLMSFYIYFNPREAMLYTTQILFPLTIIIAQGFTKVTPKLGIKYYILGVCSLYLAMHNIRILYGGTWAS